MNNNTIGKKTKISDLETEMKNMNKKIDDLTIELFIFLRFKNQEFSMFLMTHYYVPGKWAQNETLFAICNICFYTMCH